MLGGSPVCRRFSEMPNFNRQASRSFDVEGRGDGFTIFEQPRTADSCRTQHYQCAPHCCKSKMITLPAAPWFSASPFIFFFFLGNSKRQV